MSATGERTHRRAVIDGADAGATLLEMLVVVALMALTGVLVFANFRPAVDRSVLEASRTELMQTLDRARARARWRSPPPAVELARGGSAYGGAGRTVVLAQGVRLESDAPTLSFSANGLCPGARLALVRRGRRLVVQVDAGGLVSVPGPG